MLENKIELLERIPIFNGLSGERLVRLADCGQKTFFQEGDRLIAEGERGDTAYLIMTGKASCPHVENGEVLTQDLWPGTFVGELAMLVDTVHSFTVTAQERVRALAFHRHDVHAVMEADPAIAQHISEKLLVRLHGLAADLRKVDNQLAEMESAA